MTALPQGRGLATPSHLKSTSTAKPSRLEAVRNSGERPSALRSQSRARASRSRQDAGTGDAVSETSTLSLIRRILAPEKSQTNDPRDSPQPIEDILPPLTSSNETDVQLYAIVAIILKDFVNIWYSKITADHGFNEEVIQIIAHCTRALEQRMRQVDLVEILLDDLAALVDQHVKAYRYAKIQSEQYSYASSLQSVYHSINPHPALEPVPSKYDQTLTSQQTANEVVYRQLLAHGAIAMLLPTDDLRNDPLRILVCDILADLVLGQVLMGKVCEGWFLQDIIIKSVASFRGQIDAVAMGKEAEANTKPRLQQYGLLEKGNRGHSKQPAPKQRSAISTWFWGVMQVGYSLVLFARFAIYGLNKARGSEGRSYVRLKQRNSPAKVKSSSVGGLENMGRCDRPVLSYEIHGTLATIFRLQDRMPWLTSTLMFFQHLLLSGIGQLASYDSILDRFLHDSLTSILLPPSIVPQILISFRAAVFPHNSLGPPAPPPPSQEERVLIRTKAAESIVSLIPPVVARTYFNSSDEDEIVEQVAVDILDCFDDKYLNKHLIYGILELLLVKLIPEMRDHSVTELLAERGVIWTDEENDITIDDNFTNTQQ